MKFDNFLMDDTFNVGFPLSKDGHLHIKLLEKRRVTDCLCKSATMQGRTDTSKNYNDPHYSCH